MKLRNASLVVALLVAVGGCKKSKSYEYRAEAGVAEITTGSSDPWAKQKVAKDPLPKPLLWSVEKDGKTDYILGTMHTGVDPETRLPDIVWSELDKAKTFAMETNLSEAGKLEVKRSDGTTLEHELGPEYWKKLQAALGVDKAGALRGYKAMIPVTMLSLRGLPATAPMDGALYGRAINEHKEIVYLEDITLQGAVLEKWMDGKALKDMLDDLDIGDKRAKDMLDAYVAGDEARIEALSNEERDDFLRHGRTQKEYDEQMEDILYKRNASWIPTLERIHGGAFVAVGAMHLVGKRSVLDLLQQKGYKVTRITPATPAVAPPAAAAAAP